MRTKRNGKNGHDKRPKFPTEQKVGAETRKLSAPLTKQEFHDRAKDLAAAHERYAALESEHKAHLAQHKERKDALDAEIARLATVVATEQEERDVEVELWRDYRKGEFQVRRAGTREVLDRRALTDEERQRELPISDKPPADFAPTKIANKNDVVPVAGAKLTIGTQEVAGVAYCDTCKREVRVDVAGACVNCTAVIAAPVAAEKPEVRA